MLKMVEDLVLSCEAAEWFKKLCGQLGGEAVLKCDGERRKAGMRGRREEFV